MYRPHCYASLTKSIIALQCFFGERNARAPDQSYVSLVAEFRVSFDVLGGPDDHQIFSPARLQTHQANFLDLI